MQVGIIRMPADTERQDLLEENFRLRYRASKDRDDNQALNTPDRRDVDELDAPDAVHNLIIEGGALVGGTRQAPLDRLNLLQTAYSGLVHGELPDHSSLGADWTRFYVLSDRREDERRTPGSAALFFTVTEHALNEGYRFRAFVPPVIPNCISGAPDMSRRPGNFC